MPKQTANPGAPGQINMIAEGTTLEGVLRATGDVRVSGRIVGELRVEGKAIIAQEGVVEGELFAQHADIAGNVQGNVKVKDRLVLRSTANVDSDVHTARIVIEEGAIFGGKCQMGAAGAAAESPAKPEAEAKAESKPSKAESNGEKKSEQGEPVHANGDGGSGRKPAWQRRG